MISSSLRQLQALGMLWTFSLLKSCALGEEIPVACHGADIVTKLNHQLLSAPDFGQSACGLKHHWNLRKMVCLNKICLTQHSVAALYI